MKKIFFLFIFFVFVSNSFALSYDEEIKKLQQDIYDLQSRINNLDNKKILNDIKFNARIFFGISDTDNKSELNNKIYSGLDKDNYSNFKMNQVRLGMKKIINDKITFNFKIKASNSSFNIYDAYLRYNISNYVSFDIGQINTIISLENENSGNGSQFASSTRYYMVGNLFFYSGIGFKVSQIYDNFGVFYGLYGNSYSESVDNLSKSVAVFRTYYNPYKNKNNLIHFGVDYYLSHAKYKSDMVPNIDGSNLLYTISNVNNIVLEFSVNYENINLQSNYAFSIVKPSKKGYNKDFNFYSYYIQIGYIPTGESLEYDSGSFGIIDNVRRPIDSGGFGAFETVFRYSKTNMQDIVSNIVFDYGSYDKYSFAVNWMPINNAKVIFEYSRILEKFIDNYMTSKINNGTKNSYDMFTIMFKLFF